MKFDGETVRTGSGRADKAQVTAMVMRILGLQTAPTPADAADALALGICHCWRAPMIARMAKAEAMAAEQKRKYDVRLAEERKARAAVARRIEKMAKKEAGAR